MYKMLIVEDERWEREGLVDFLDWGELGIELVGTASDGIEGYERAMELEPHIIITDIRMPGMDGLEMSRRIKLIHPNIRIIILTGYGDFEYARKAIHFQVSYYVLKPVDERMMLEAIGKVLDECNRDERLQQESELMRTEIREYRSSMRETWVEELLIGELDARIAAELAVEAGFDLENDSFLAIAVADKGEWNAQQVADAAAGPHIALRRKAQGGEWLIVMPAKSDLILTVRLLASGLASTVRFIHPEDLLLGVGRVVSSLLELHVSVGQAENALEYGRFWGDSGLIDQDRLEKERAHFLNEAGDFLQRGSRCTKIIMSSVQALQEEQAITALHELLDDIEACRGAEREYIRNYLSGLLFELRVLGGTAVSEPIEAADSDKGLDTFANIKTIRSYITGYVRQVLSVLDEKRNDKEEFIIAKVNRLIEQKYMSDDISLKSIADEVFLSPNYLGSLYKKTMGHAFHDELTRVRMNKAKELLAQPEYKVSRAGKEVGITNTSYFCTVFKNTFGLSPGEYQEMLHLK